jgi:hypothetical protein
MVGFHGLLTSAGLNKVKKGPSFGFFLHALTSLPPQVACCSARARRSSPPMLGKKGLGSGVSSLVAGAADPPPLHLWFGRARDVPRLRCRITCQRRRRHRDEATEGEEGDATPDLF